MKTKTAFFSIWILGLSLTLMSVGCSDGNDHQNHAAASGETYTCPMHPTVVSDKPGSCPVCGMQLVKKVAAADLGEKLKLEIGQVALSPADRVMANVQTSLVTYGRLNPQIRTVGKLTYNERKQAHVSAWVAGRVDTLFVDFTGERVYRGQAVLSMYSPDLLSTQEELVLALETQDRLGQGTGVSEAVTRSANSQAEAARRRLELWGMSDEQLEELEQNRRVQTHTRITSPITGTVTRKMVHPNMYVSQGQILYDIADLSTVWMHADVYEHEMALVAVGQRVEVTTEAYPGRIFAGRITFINPFLDAKSRTVRVRAELSNRSGELRPEMYVNATIETGGNERVLSIPVTAVLHTGGRTVVWVEIKRGVFEPRDVVLGRRASSMIEILDGLLEAESVVTRGGFLLDSEAQLRAVGSPDPHAGHGDMAPSSSADSR